MVNPDPNVRVETWVDLSGGVDITPVDGAGDGHFDFRFEGGDRSFEVGFDAVSLARFVDVAQTALGKRPQGEPSPC